MNRTFSGRYAAAIALLRLPDRPGMPEPLRGALSVHLRIAYVGDPRDGERLADPLVHAAPALLGGLQEMPYSDIGLIHDDPTEPMPSWDLGILLHSLPAEGVEALLAAAGPGIDIPLVLIDIRHLGVALSRQPRVPNSADGRDAEFSLFAAGALPPPLRELVPAAGHAVLEAMAPWSTGQTHPNFAGPQSTEDNAGRAWSPEV